MTSPLFVPLMTRETFASLIGLPSSVVIAQCDKGYWPIVRVGKRVLINVALVNQRALEKEFK